MNKPSSATNGASEPAVPEAAAPGTGHPDVEHGPPPPQLVLEPTYKSSDASSVQFGTLTSAADNPKAGFLGRVGGWMDQFKFDHCVDFMHKVAEHAMDATHVAMDSAKQAVTDAAAAKFDRWASLQRLYYVEDPAMPSCVRPVARAVWDAAAPLCRREFLSVVEFEMGLRQRRPIAAEHNPRDLSTLSCFQRCITRTRAWILYTLLPFDKTLWGRMTNPWWWLLSLALANPFLGIQSWLFAILLCMIDREDDFQLLQFIMHFKKMQFWVVGLAELLVYTADMVYCINVVVPQYTTTCGERGPGSSAVWIFGNNGVFFLMFFGWVAQLVLVWAALILLHFSIPKGGSVRRGFRLVGDTVLWREEPDTAAFLLASHGLETPSPHGNPESPLQETKHNGTAAESSPVGKNEDGVVVGCSVRHSSTPLWNKAKQVTFVGKVQSFDQRTQEHTVAIRKEVNGTHVHIRKRLHDCKYYVLEAKVPLRRVIFYDTACFLMVGFLVGMWFLSAKHRGTLQYEWQWRALLTACRVGYALTAFPFFVCWIPPWKMIFTHAKDTGYTRFGELVTIKPYMEYDWVVPPLP